MSVTTTKQHSFFAENSKAKPEYDEKSFKSEKDFEKWLREKAVCVIRFSDHGQDFLEWWLDRGGEVLHCTPFQSSVWNGTIVDVSYVDDFLAPRIRTPRFQEEWRSLNYPIEELRLICQGCGTDKKVFIGIGGARICPDCHG